MTFDLIGGIELTVSAAIVVAILAHGLGATTRARAMIAAGFGLWFAAVTALAATAVLHREDVLGVAGLGLSVLLPVAALAAATAASERANRALHRIPIAALVAANAVRVLGVSFVLLYAQGRLPAPFAPVAGWGDIAVGVAAPFVAWLVATRRPGAREALVLWNSLGLADLVVAVGLGLTSSPGVFQLFGSQADSGIMTMLPWLLIPGFLVPILASTHLAIFYRLRSGLGRAAELSSSGRPAVAG